MKRLILAIVLSFPLTSCAGQYVSDVSVRTTLTGPKEIIVLTGTDRISNVIIRDLKKRGIQVSVLPPNVETNVTPQYGMSIDWSVVDRCFAGGWHYFHLTVELYDLATNDLLYSDTKSGFSEDCAPLSGTIFQDFANEISALFTGQ